MWPRRWPGYLGVGAFLTLISPSPQPDARVVVFFHLVNKTGTEIQVQVLANGQELFVQRLPGAVDASSRTVPAAGLYPAVERKITMSGQATRLEVRELLILRQRKAFKIAGFSRVGAGFQIVVSKAGITLSQDYHPVR